MVTQRRKEKEKKEMLTFSSQSHQIFLLSSSFCDIVYHCLNNTSYYCIVYPGKLRETKSVTQEMASVSMAMPVMSATQNRTSQPSSLLKSIIPVKKAVFVKPKSIDMFKVEASLKEKAVTGLTAAALTASMVIPEVAEAAGAGVSPSLNNFLLSIAAGGVVLVAILGAVIGVSNFDPVKRT